MPVSNGLVLLVGAADASAVSDVFESTSSTATSSTVSSDDECSSPDLRQGSRKAHANREAYTFPGEKWAPKTVVPEQEPSDWLWTEQEEPHRTRRKAIMKAHPEVIRLIGHEPLTKYVVIFVTLLQISVAILLRSTPFFSFKFLATAYFIGATANQNTFLAVHEVTHNLAFRGVRASRLFAIFTNLPIGIPYAMMFKKYHIEHHKFLAEDGIDTDMPSKLELRVLSNIFGKAFFATFQIFFYALRPGFIRYQAPTRWTFSNIAVQLTFDALLVQFAGWNALFYLVMSSFLAGSLHPCAGHFIAEHYLFDGLDQETWSYYGPLNILAYNVGYHNEHHDFPAVPWTRLPALRKMAREFYDPLPCHTSWPLVIAKFIFDGKIGMWSRVRREPSKAVSPDAAGGGAGGITAGGLKDE